MSAELASGLQEAAWCLGGYAVGYATQWIRNTVAGIWWAWRHRHELKDLPQDRAALKRHIFRMMDEDE